MCFRTLRRSGSRSLFKKKVTLWRSVTEVEMSAGTERTGGGSSAGTERTGVTIRNRFGLLEIMEESDQVYI